MKKILFVALALVFGLVSCVKDKQYPGITISNVSYSPTSVQSFNDVTVSATISCFNEFTAKVVYNINGASNEVAMTAGDTYTAVIPAQPDGTTVSFYVEASNDDATTKSAAMDYTVGAVPVDYSVLRLNELNGNDKFIEIFNNGAEAINMNGVTIYKDTEKLVWTGKAAVTVEPGAYLLLYSEDVINDHPEIDTALYVFHSGLSAKKNVRIEIKTPAGVGIDDFNLVDIDQNGAAYGYPGNQAPASYSRNADTDWYYADATPGAANVDGENKVLGLEGGPTPPPTPDYADLILNELNGQDHKKFIEIYNAGTLAINMEGVTIYKDTDKLVWTGKSAINIEPGAYLLLFSEDVFLDYPDRDTTLYMFHSGLSAKKNVRIELKDPSGVNVGDFNLTHIEYNGEAYGYSGNQAPDSYSLNADGLWYYSDATPEAINIDGENLVLGLETPRK